MGKAFRRASMIMGILLKEMAAEAEMKRARQTRTNCHPSTPNTSLELIFLLLVAKLAGPMAQGVSEPQQGLSHFLFLLSEYREMLD